MRLSLRPLVLVLGITLGLLGALSAVHPARAQFDALGADLDGVAGGDVAWADVDNDGDSDLLLIGNQTGSTDDAQPSATLYENQGDGTFSPFNAGLDGVSAGSAAFGDFDGDGDPDLIITGNQGGFSAQNLPKNSATVYENDGSGHFSPVNAGIDGVTVGSVDWGDVDGDTDLDLVVAGNVGGVGDLCPVPLPIPMCDDPDPSIRIYENEGDGSFTPADASISEGVAVGSSRFGDIDDDGDLDLAVTGGQGNLDNPLPFSAVYENDGDGNFSNVDADIEDLAGRSALWTDVNGDESLDLVLTGVTGEEGDDHKTLLYLNDGDGGFSEEPNTLPDVAAGTVAAADVDLDGDADLLVSGQDNSDSPVASIFENDGTGAFDPLNADLTPVEGSAAAWGDVGGETVPDLALVGRDADSTATATIYENQIGGVAQAQFIHNAADPGADTVDVYFGNERALDDIVFRSATEFIDVPADLNIEAGVAPAGSSGPEDVVATQTVTFDADEAHTVVANGVLNPDDFADNPDGEPIGFEFFVESGAKTTASSGEVDLRAVHGATDAPTVDVGEVETSLFEGLTYGDVTSNYLTATADEKLLSVTDSDADTLIAAFQADLSGLEGSAATVLASGFLDPSANQAGPAFRLIAARPNGTVVTFAPNQSPTVATPLPDDTVETPGPPLQLTGLNTTVFGDPDGDTMSFAATSATPSVVEVVEDPSKVLLQPVGTGTAEVTVTASDGVSETSTTFQVTVEEREGEAPIAQALALVNTSGEGQTVDLGDTGSKIVPRGVQGTGRVEVQRFENAPDHTDGIDEENVSHYRTVITVGGTLDLGSNTEVRFPVADFAGIEDPAQVTVYSRSTPGGGTFSALPTSVDANGTSEDSSDDEIVATTGSFSEFVLASDTEPLPVELAAFTATVDKSTVRLRWRTASETRNSGFRVQRGTDRGWREVGFVESKAEGGTTTEARSYRFVVDQLTPGTHRFRLKQVDLDGSTSLSKVVRAEVPLKGALELTAPAPNPASGQATLSFAVKEATDAEVVMYNVLGQKVRTLYEGVPRAGQSTRLTVETGSLPSGVYVVQLRADGQTKTRRLTVVQ